MTKMTRSPLLDDALDALVTECTAFPFLLGEGGLVDAMRRGYVPTLSIRDDQQAKLGAELIELGWDVYWIRPS